jgi:hypothetical protein
MHVLCMPVTGRSVVVFAEAAGRVSVLAMVRPAQSAAILRVIGVIAVGHQLLTSTRVMIGNGGFGVTACGPLTAVVGCF